MFFYDVAGMASESTMASLAMAVADLTIVIILYIAFEGLNRQANKMAVMGCVNMNA